MTVRNEGSRPVTDREGSVAVPHEAWLPPGKKASVVWTIDDVHPAKSNDGYEAGGDLDDGALGLVLRLLERHPQLSVTLFVTADWRELAPIPTRTRLARTPILRDLCYLSPIRRRGEMAIDRHPGFVEFLSNMPRTEIALHGLHHVHRGPNIPVEFQGDGLRSTRSRLRRAIAHFERAGLPFSPGIQPPGWNFPSDLESASTELGLRWVASSRDIVTPISPNALSAMSGRSGLSLIFPERLQSGIIHFATNFQATSSRERAHQVVEAGGVLAIKAHIVKEAFGYVMKDGVDEVYMNFLDSLFTELAETYGDQIDWTTMGELADRIYSQ